MPVTVTEYVPDGVAADVEMVSVAELPEVTVAGAKEAVAPDGRPPAVRFTDCAEPDVVVVLTVVAIEPPGATEPEVGDTATEKSFAGGVPSLTT